MDDIKLKEERLKLEKTLKSSGGNKIFIEEVIKEFEENDVEGLEFRLKSIAQHKQAVLSTQASDEELEKAKLNVKFLNAPYNEQKRGCDQKSRYIGLLLQEINGFQSETEEE